MSWAGDRMIGYAIAALKKEKSIIGLKVITLEDNIIKDLTLKSVKLLYGKSKDMFYNLENLSSSEIQRLPILDVENGKLSKDLWTVMLNVGKQYLIANAKGVTYSVSETEAKKFRFTNAHVEEGSLIGKFVVHDTGEKQYDAWLLFEQPVQIDNGELYIKNAEVGSTLEIPSVVTSVKIDCWRNAPEFDMVRLGVNMAKIGQGDLDGLHTRDLLIPVGVNKLNSFAFSNCTAQRVIIEGNTLPSAGVFNNANIVEVYVNNALLNKYRAVAGSGIKIKGLSEIVW